MQGDSDAGIISVATINEKCRQAFNVNTSFLQQTALLEIKRSKGT